MISPLDDVATSSGADVETFRKPPEEDEARKHFHTISELRFRENTTNPIARLPPEILGYIFLWHVAIEQKFSWRWGGEDYYRWMRVTHVCHHWREVALNTPRLWTNIFVVFTIGLEDRINSFLARSGQAPLRLHIETDNLVQTNSDWASTTQRAMSQVIRAEALKLVGSATSQLAAAYLPSTAPILQSLDLRGGWDEQSVFSFSNFSAPALLDFKASGLRIA